ncbi:hypothetical protein QE152_g36234 [Popillia japonica]|uniref:Uncharacterized protein n=1 Tax=Popillia japonica TaxID=7064 RepID=A0AAW1IDR2_POPJA
MPLTREQINDIKVVVKDCMEELFRDDSDIKVVVKDCMEELFRDDSFIERIGDIVTKSIEKKIDDVLKKLKTCAAKLFISEDLTKTKYELYRATQKRCGNRNVWCIDGEIKVKMRNKVFAIKSLHDLSTV